MKIIREGLTFDDVLIVPQYSDVGSRNNVDLSTKIGEWGDYNLPILSSNMDTVTGSSLAKAMLLNKAGACLHRFQTVEQIANDFMNAVQLSCGADQDFKPMVSFGLGPKELSKAFALYDKGADQFVLDVAHGAQEEVLKTIEVFRKEIPADLADLIVGNFASAESVGTVLNKLRRLGVMVTAVKVGIGPGSACTTRIKTGVGYPQLSALLEIVPTARDYGVQVIADGGMRTSGDIAKALACGADMVMLGGMLAGTFESPGDIYDSEGLVYPGVTLKQISECFNKRFVKKYRGSASKESYGAQGKTTVTPEGESFSVPYKGSVSDVLAEIKGGLQSAFTYVGAKNLKEFQERAKFVKITNAGVIEGKAHGKK